MKNPVLNALTTPNRLTEVQTALVNNYFDCEESPSKLAEYLAKPLILVETLLSSKPVRRAIVYRTKQVTDLIRKEEKFNVHKEDRLQLLWTIAQNGVNKIYDKEGNEVMSSPATSVSAIRTINEMLPGSLAPQQVDVNVKIEDKRNEQEIKDSILALTTEYTRLAALEGVNEKVIAKSEALPAIDITNA